MIHSISCKFKQYMKKLFLFTIVSVSLILSSCRKDEEKKLTSNICLKLSENDYEYEYDTRNIIKRIYRINEDGTKNIAKSYFYSSDTIIEVFNLGAMERIEIATNKSIIGSNGFIHTSLLTISLKSGEIINNRKDTFIYNEEGYLIKTIGSSFKNYFFYKNGNLIEEWYTLNTDSAILHKYEYDLLNENKEAGWKEWIERKGKANKNLPIKHWDFSTSNSLLNEYTYLLKNGFPIKTNVKYSGEFDTTNFLINSTWSCLQ